MLGDLTPERWQKIKSVLNQILGEDPTSSPDRETLDLQSLCGDDSTLRLQVEEILRFRNPGDDEDPFAEDYRETTSYSPAAGPSLSLGDEIGPYKLIRPLGAGGMGVVFLAEREDLSKRVAIKLIRCAFDGLDKSTQRFRNEEQILARLEHPGIAQLFDAGALEDGLPYFVMEYVEGESLDRYCASRHLSVRDRLRIFLKICSAVQFAHKNMVVHRDLKPGNLWVTESGEPKLLDFGISKLLDTERAVEITTQGFSPMTLAYASPEQVQGGPITTASDVYSLGVVLYELLTGERPYPPEGLVKAICHGDPHRPSTVVGRLPATRGFPDSPQQLSRQLTGDLDSIVLEAMQKIPDERYSSVERLADDIQRHLNGLPVEAREGNLAYRVGKFVRRNRMPLMVASALLLVLFTGSTSLVLWNNGLERTRQLNFQTDQAEAVSEILKDLFRAFGPDESEGNPPDPLAILHQARQEVQKKVEDPLLRISLLGTLGEIYRDLGRYSESQDIMELALRLAQQTYPADHSVVARRLVNLAVLHHEHGEAEKAVPLLQQAYKMLLRLGQEDDALTAQSNLAAVYMFLEEFETAERLYLEVLQNRIELFGPNHKRVATIQRNLGSLYFLDGKPEKADLALQEALRIRKAELGDSHTSTASIFALLGTVKTTLGDYDEATSLLAKALEIQSQRFGEDHPRTALTKSRLAAAQIPADPESAHVLAKQAFSVLRAEKPGSWQQAEAEGTLGAILTAQGRYAEAEPYLLSAYSAILETRGKRTVYTQTAQRRLRELYELWNRPALSEKYRPKLRRTTRKDRPSGP